MLPISRVLDILLSLFNYALFLLFLERGDFFFFFLNPVRKRTSLHKGLLMFRIWIFPEFCDSIRNPCDVIRTAQLILVDIYMHIIIDWTRPRCVFCKQILCYAVFVFNLCLKPYFLFHLCKCVGELVLECMKFFCFKIKASLKSCHECMYSAPLDQLLLCLVNGNFWK